MIRRKTEMQVKLFLFTQWIVGSISLIGSVVVFQDKPVPPDIANAILFVIFITAGVSMTLMDVYKAWDKRQRKLRLEAIKNARS